MPALAFAQQRARQHVNDDRSRDSFGTGAAPASSYSMQDWIREHRYLLSWLTAGSAIMIAVMSVVVPMCIVRMRHDYFVCGSSDRRSHPSSLGHRLISVGRNILAVILIIAGVSMLLLPGPGIITLVMGLLLLEFPGHHKLRRWLLGRKSVLGALNWLRRKAHCQPLTAPDVDRQETRKAA